MKKIIFTTLIFLLLFPQFAISETSNESQFTIRNGIMFNMTMDEVMKRETAPINRISDKNVWIEYYPVNIAGIDNCLVQYSFYGEKETLSSVFIRLCEDDDNYIKVSGNYDKVNRPLLEKYGTPLGNRNGDINVYASTHLKLLNAGIALNTIADYKYDEWIFALNEDTIIKIDHIYSYMNGSKYTRKSAAHYICYNLYTINEFANDI